MLASDFGPRDLGDADPGAFDDSGAVGFQEWPIDGGDEGFGVGGDDDAGEFVADGQFAHHAEMHEAFPGAAFGITMLEVPAGGFKGRSS